MTEERRIELKECIRKMHETSMRFYGNAIQTGNHAFIEFCGLQAEYIKMCEDALQSGLDFTEFNIHAGKHLPMAPYQRAYLNEKLSCIYGRQIVTEDMMSNNERGNVNDARSVSTSL